MKRYYFAYGMNTNLREMARRCPAAISMGASKLLDHKFAFRMHADVEASQGDSVNGVLWDITEDCERALDNLEGYPYYYEKKEVVVNANNGQNYIAMVYYMVDQGMVHPPSQGYYDCLVEGYTAHGVDVSQIDNALDFCYDDR